MNWQTITNQTFVENIGWTLVHSIWQISLVAFLLFVALRVLKNISANFRYLICVAVLFAALFIPVLTFISFSNSSKQHIKTGLERVETNISPEGNIVRKNKNIAGELTQTGETVKRETDNLSGKLENFKTQAVAICEDLVPYLVWMWILGILCFTFRFGGGIWQTQKLKTSHISLPEEKWTAKFEELCEKVGISFKVNFLQSELVETPMVIGWLKPLVIVPSSVLMGLNPRELETIIAHELIHIRRHDYLVNILQSFVEIVLFFHPLTWWISAQVRRERENACDDEVLRMFDTEPLLYANALANLEEFRFESVRTLPSNVLAANGGNLMSRIQRIIKNAAGIQNSKGSIWSSGMAFLLAFVISVIMFSASFYVGFHNNNDEATTRMDAKRIAIALSSTSQFIAIPDIADMKDPDETMVLLTANLKRYRIPIVGYATTEGSVVNQMKGRDERIIGMWRDAGFEIGASYLKFPKSFNTTLDDYKRIRDTRRNAYEKELMPDTFTQDSEMAKIKAQFEYFRKRRLEPLSEEDSVNLRKEVKEFMESEDVKKYSKAMSKNMDVAQNKMNKWLKDMSLKNVTFTINSYDWLYSNAYDIARHAGDKNQMEHVQNEYLEYLSRVFDYYEETSQRMYDRKIPQTFGLEPSRIVADSLDLILEMIKKRGYEFISMDEALNDEAFQTIDGFGGHSSFFDSARLRRKQPDEKFVLPQKPKAHEDVMKAWYKEGANN